MAAGMRPCRCLKLARQLSHAKLSGANTLEEEPQFSPSRLAFALDRPCCELLSIKIYSLVSQSALYWAKHMPIFETLTRGSTPVFWRIGNIIGAREGNPNGTG